MGYENWQARPGFKLAVRTLPLPAPAADSAPSLRRRLAVVLGLGLASWALLIGVVGAAVWVFAALGAL